MNQIEKTLLLVDDDPDYLFQLKLKVENMGFKTVTCEGQYEAASLLEKWKPDMAILDLMMENDDSGFILASIIKRIYPDVPVIIATAVSAETGMIFGLDDDDSNSWIKADAFFDKGIRNDQLKNEIFRLLQL